MPAWCGGTCLESQQSESRAGSSNSRVRPYFPHQLVSRRDATQFDILSLVCRTHMVEKEEQTPTVVTSLHMWHGMSSPNTLFKKILRHKHTRHVTSPNSSWPFSVPYWVTVLSFSYAGQRLWSYISSPDCFLFCDTHLILFFFFKIYLLYVGTL